MDNLVSQMFSGSWDITDFVGVIVLVAVAGGLITGIVAVVTSYYRDSQRDEMDATLKMEMIQRGMSADEIEKVLKANSGSFDPPPWAAELGRDSCRDARRAMRDAMRSTHGHSAKA
jgi:hypothetical protein